MQVKSNADKRIYDMIDVLREGNMRWECVDFFIVLVASPRLSNVSIQ